MNQRTSQLATLVVVMLFVVAMLGFGITPAAAQSEGRIGGIVYEDTNGNGIREEGEEGIKDVEVKFDSGGWNTTISTADSGAFSLNVNPATWTVTVLPPAGYDAPKESIEVFISAPGDAVTNLEFGLVAVTDEDSGEVLPDSGGVVSETIIIGGLATLLGVGVVLVAVGQVRNRRGAS